MPDDLPPFETVSHLYGTGITCEGALYDGTTGEEKTRFADFIRADRQKLRDWLSTNIPIEWNKKYERYEEVEKGITVFFTDGTTVSGSILVGADGGHSKVRNQLVGAERGQCNLIPLLMGRSLWIAESPIGYIFVGLHCIAEDKNSAKYYFMVFRRHEGEINKVHPILEWSKQELYDAAIKTTMGLHPKFASILLSSHPEGMVQPPYVLEDWVPPPNGFSSARATLLGDAAHKMSPSDKMKIGGEGGNHAMQDALDFVRVLDTIGAEDTLKLLSEFERATIPRATEAVLKNRAKTIDWENETSNPTWSKESK
ncbi:hypothetical protein SLS57_011588 [Botryosphaeria dothidea]